jgi:hypothetical protein
LLGGEKPGLPKPYAPERDNVVFIGDARDHPGSVSLILILQTRKLLPFPYPSAQLPLSERVIALRERDGLSFAAIAAQLALEGWKGARGASLEANGVYSVYTKRKAHDERRYAPVIYWITDIVVQPSDAPRDREGVANIASTNPAAGER